MKGFYEWMCNHGNDKLILDFCITKTSTCMINLKSCQLPLTTKLKTKMYLPRKSKNFDNEWSFDRKWKQIFYRIVSHNAPQLETAKTGTWTQIITSLYSTTEQNWKFEVPNIYTSLQSKCIVGYLKMVYWMQTILGSKYSTTECKQVMTLEVTKSMEIWS